MQITVSNLEKAVEIIDSLTEKDVEELSEKYIQTQQDFMAYMMSSAFEFENEQLLDYMVYYYHIFMEAIHQQGIDLKVIDNKMIDLFHDDYIGVLDEYSQTSDKDIIESFCNQPTLLYFLIDEVNSKDEKGKMLPEDIQHQLFIIGIAMIGLMNKAINE